MDSVGACLSGVSLAIPYLYVELFGMPRETLIIFFIIAMIYASYSMIVYLINSMNWKFYLRIIGIFNIAYCTFTLYHVFINSNSISLLGFLYFFIEIVIVLVLSIFEIKLSFKH